MFMLFFADSSIFAQPPFNTLRTSVGHIRTSISS